jgi:SYP7 family syntaxin
MFSTPSSAGLMRSTLRDTTKRLKQIRIKCGKNDDEGKALQTTGDPFRDRMNAFTVAVKNAKELIGERNAGVKKNGQDRTAIEQSNEIRKELRGIEALLQEIKALVDESDKLLARANKKKSKLEKIQLLERQYRERESTYRQCQETFETLKGLDAQRFGPGGKKEMNAQQEVQLGKKMQLREQLMGMKRNNKTTNVGADGEMTDMGGGGGRLEDDPETKEQMKVLAAQEAKINQGLDIIGKGVGRLKEIALQIGSQLDQQNQMLDNTEHTVDKQNNQLKNINKRLGKIVKESSPVNTFINVCCVVLLLGLVGYFVYQFGLVPT